MQAFINTLDLSGLIIVSDEGNTLKNIDYLARCYKTFYVRNFLMFVIDFVPAKPFERSLLLLANNNQITLERLARDKHFSLLRTLINYERKMFYNFGPWCQ